MEKLLIYTLSAHISSVNLILCMTVLSSIGRQRPEYMANVLQALEKIEKNLPPTLGKSQITSVKKQMKMLLMTIVKQPNMVDYYGKISEILTDLGVSQSEINKAIPKNLIPTESRKRQTAASHSFEADMSSSLLSKKAKISIDEDMGSEVKQSALIDVIADDLIAKLSAQENVADLVLLTMVMLPDPMPVEFRNNYKPIAAAGTIAQIKQLARILATQLNNAGLCKSYEAIAKEKQKEEAKQSARQSKSIEDELEDNKDIDLKQKVMMEQKAALAQKSKISKAYKLSEVTKPLSKNAIENLLSNSFDRILSQEELAEKSGKNNLRKKVLYNFTTQPNYEDQLMSHIFTDVHKKLDMGVQWVFDSYLNYKNDENSETKKDQYDRVLYSLLSNLHKHEAKDL